MAELRTLWRRGLVTGNFLLLILATPAVHGQTSETVTVERLMIDAWITEYDGTPIADLNRDDVIVRIDGRRADVESVDFIPSAPRQDRDGSMVPAEPPGRLLIYFFQTDFQRVRAAGQMRMMARAQEMVGRLAPGDRVAVVSHDSHLKLLQDFTSDGGLLSDAISRSIAIAETPPHRTDGEGPSLARHLTREEARRASKPEQALLVLAGALAKIPGPKALVFFGWGLGRYGAGGVSHEREWQPARRQLQEARTSMFVLDTSSADFHSLEVALKDAAEKTGGFYEKTHVFAKQSVTRLERTLSGRYEISVIIDDVPRGTYPVEVRLVGRRGLVLAPATSVLR